MASTPEKIIREIFAMLPGYITDKAIGRRELSKNGVAGPRVVAIPLGSPVIDLPDQPGGRIYNDPVTGVAYSTRVILIRRFRIDWVCFAAPDDPDGAVDFTNSEQLCVDVMEQVRAYCHHSVVFSNESWDDQQDGADSYSRYGSQITFTATIDLPVYETPGTVRTLTGSPQIVTTVQLNSDPDTVIINE